MIILELMNILLKMVFMKEGKLQQNLMFYFIKILIQI